MSFEPGKTPVPPSGRIFDYEEVDAACEVIKSGWWTTDKVTKRFEQALSDRFGAKQHVIFCNSGSSANLLAMQALHELVPPKTLVITPALTFPTTVSAILHAGFQPVFVDVNLQDYNAQTENLQEAVQTVLKAHARCVVFLPHTLGHPWDLDLLKTWDEERVIVVEDNCDALDSTWHSQRTGTFGLISTLSFFPAHHITTGEGGAVVTRDAALARAITSYRDWGRDCWCLPGYDNSCSKRWDGQYGGLPPGYDHKYVFRHVGYNLKATDIQAALGCAQLKKLTGFTAARRANWNQLRTSLSDLDDVFWLPNTCAQANPSWFGFALGLRERSPWNRLSLVQYLESRHIGTRMLFAGNILQQPGYQNIPHTVIGNLNNTNWATERAFWIGVWPGLTPIMLDYVSESLHAFFGRKP